MTVSVGFTVPEDPTVRLGDVTIEAKPLLRVGALLAAAEAMAELGLEGDPPPIRLVDMDEVMTLTSGLLPGVDEVESFIDIMALIGRVDIVPGLWRLTLQSAPGAPQGGRLTVDVVRLGLGAIKST